MESTALEPTIHTFTLTDFLHGRPEAIIQAIQSPKILLLWPHGNEELGPRVGHYIYTQRPELLSHVDYLCGNPKAAANTPGLNFIESDLNRAFDLSHKPKTYEEYRAVQLAAYIDQAGYDYIIGLHTSVTNVGKCAIIGQPNPANKRIIAASSFKRIVVMPPDIVRHSLSGRFPNAVEFEANEKLAEDPEMLEEFTGLISRLISGAASKARREREFYYVDRSVPKTEDPGTEVENFVWCKDGYYPILFGTGKHSYRENPTKSYLGFAATRRDITIL